MKWGGRTGGGTRTRRRQKSRPPATVEQRGRNGRLNLILYTEMGKEGPKCFIKFVVEPVRSWACAERECIYCLSNFHNRIFLFQRGFPGREEGGRPPLHEHSSLQVSRNTLEMAPKGGVILGKLLCNGFWVINVRAIGGNSFLDRSSSRPRVQGPCQRTTTLTGVFIEKTPRFLSMSGLGLVR